MSQGSDFRLAHLAHQARPGSFFVHGSLDMRGTLVSACLPAYLPVCLSVSLSLSLSLSLSPSAGLILLLASVLVRAEARGNAPPQSRHHEAW
jgi:hypothetical protein